MGFGGRRPWVWVDRGGRYIQGLSQRERAAWYARVGELRCMQGKPAPVDERAREFRDAIDEFMSVRWKRRPYIKAGTETGTKNRPHRKVK